MFVLSLALISLPWQCLLAKLQRITETVPQGESLLKALESSDSQDLIPSIQKHLQEAKVRCTAASQQSTQDAYVFFFATLKTAELLMLEAGSRSELSSTQREELLRSSLSLLLESLEARSIIDNCDLVSTIS